MSPVSLSEPYMLVWEQIGFPKGRENRWLLRTEAEASANYPNSCGHIPWLKVKRCGQFLQRLWTISAMALDKR